MWRLLFVALVLAGCASVREFPKDYGAPGAYAVAHVRDGSGCSAIHPAALKTPRGEVLWGYQGGFSDQESLVRHWASHGFRVVASDAGSLENLTACRAHFGRVEAPSVYYPGWAVHVSDRVGVGDGSLGAGSIRMVMTGGELGRTPIDGLGLERLQAESRDLLVVLEGLDAPSETALGERLRSSDTPVIWARAAKGSIADRDLKAISTAWIFAQLTTDGQAEAWFKPGPCWLCDNPAWRATRTGQWRPSVRALGSWGALDGKRPGSVESQWRTFEQDIEGAWRPTEPVPTTRPGTRAWR